MNNLAITAIKPSIYDFSWQQAVNKMYLLAEDKGICNMVAAAAKAIEDMEVESIELYGDVHYETELSKNRDHAIKILDFAMNACDLDEENATRFDRIQKAKAMRDQLDKYITELGK